MPRLTVEPHKPVGSLAQLFAIVAAIEERSAAVYSEIAMRMRAAERGELAELFENLAASARGHHAAAADQHQSLAGRRPEPSALPGGAAMAIFDDEGMAVEAPELASVYGAFAMAVRNVERAFALWTYVAAHSPSTDVRQKAEQMAREEMQRSTALRRERRRAFHRQRASDTVDGNQRTLEDLERRLSELLEVARQQTKSAAEAAKLEQLAIEARERADEMSHATLGISQFLRHLHPGRIAHHRPAAELLLDCYLDLAEQLPTQEGRERAQRSASQLLTTVFAAK